MISKLMLIEQKTLKQLIGTNTNVDVNIVKDILKLDPKLKPENISDNTEIGIYGEWLLGKLYKNYNHLTDKDKNNIKEKLQFYDYLIRSKRIPLEYNNIYKIKSIEELIDIVNKIQGNNPITQDQTTVSVINHKFKTVSGNPLDLLKQQYYGEIKENGNTKWLVFKPKNKSQSIVAGYNTSWCTSRDDYENQWQDYIYEGNTAWIFLLSGKYKIDNPNEFTRLTNEKLDKVCIIVERAQCQTRNNIGFNLSKLPEIGRFIEDKIDSWEIKLENGEIFIYKDEVENYILPCIKNPNNRLRLLLNKGKLFTIINTLPSKDIQFYLSHYPEQILKCDPKNQMNYIPNNIKLIDKILNAFKENNRKIDKNIQLQQVSKNGFQIYYIDNPDKDVQLQQVSQIGHQIEYIENPDKDVQMQQVLQNGKQIYYIRNPDKDIQLQQVSQDGKQIYYIKNPDKDVQMQQVSQKGIQIRDIIKNGIKPDKDVQMQQVTQDGKQILYIDNPDKDIQIQQIKQNPEQYFSIINLDPEQRQLYKQLMGIKESARYINKLLDVN